MASKISATVGDTAMAESPEKIILGSVTGVYGVKGWLKIFSYTDPISGPGVDSQVTDGTVKMQWHGKK